MTDAGGQAGPRGAPRAGDHDGAAGVVSREIATAQVEPGAGYVARHGDMVLWAEQAPGPRGTEALDAAIVGFSDIAASGLLADQAMARISTLLTDARVGSLAGLAVLVPTASGMVSVASGWGAVAGSRAAAANGRRDDAGRDGDGSSAGETAERRVTGGATIRMAQLNHELLIVGREDVAGRLAGVGMSGQPATVGLVQGVVPGGAVQVATRLTIGSDIHENVIPVAPPPGDGPPPPPPDAAPAAEQDVEVVSFRKAAARPPAAPPQANNADEVVIEGIQCGRGHLNDPLALHCGTCGLSMIKHSGSRVEGVRPPLGIVVFDDGATYALGTHLIIGSSPNQADAVREGRAQGVTLADSSGRIEPLHAEVRLEGWQVLLVDWSNQGTYVLPEEAKTWQAAPRGAPFRLIPGTRIALGDRTATFDNPTRR